MWMNLISSDVVKGVVDIGTALIKFLDTGIGKITVLLGLFKGFSLHGQFKASGQESFLDFLLGGAKDGLGKVKDLSGIKDIVGAVKTGYTKALAKEMSGNVAGEIIEKILNKEQVEDVLDNVFDGINVTDLFASLASSGVDVKDLNILEQAFGINDENFATKVFNVDEIRSILNSLSGEVARIKPVDLFEQIVQITEGDTSIFDALYEALGVNEENWTENIVDPDGIREALESVGELDEAQIEAIMSSNLFSASQTGAAVSTDIFTLAIAKAKAALIGLKDGFIAAATAHPYLMAFTLAAVAITGVVAAYKKWGPTHENAIKKLEKETEELQSVQDELKSVNSELESVQDSMNKLQAKDTLTFVEEQELERLKSVSAELERQKAILEAKESREQEQQVKAAVKAANRDPILKGGSQAAAPVYAAISEKTGIVDYSQTNSFESNLKALENAKKRFAEAEAKLMEANEAGWSEDDPSTRHLYKKLQKDVEKAREAVERYNTALDTMSNDWQANYGEVGFITKEDGEELTSVEEKWNDIYRAYHDAMDRQALLNNDITKADVLERVFGKTGTEAAQAFKDEFASSFRRGEDPSEIIEQALANEDYAKLFKNILNQFGITAADIADWFAKGGSAIFDRALVETKTYSALVSKIESINGVQKQTQEILTDGTVVTQEYKDALIDLVGSEEKVNECFVDGNGLVVKNADGLDDLIKVSKKNIASQAKLAKTQARLKYAELYNKIKELRESETELTDATRAQINAYYDEMSALQSSIAQYTILEQKLLGASNAYERLAAAQEIDAANDYGSKAEELMNVLTSAFKSGEVGTEAFKVALEGMIPEEVYADAKNLDDALKKIQKYAKEGDLSTLFTVKYGSDGAVESVEMTKKNIMDTLSKWSKTELDDGSGTIFTKLANGNFELNPAITSLKDLAEETNLTEEVVFAFLTELEKYDLSHLGGDNGTLLEQLMGDDLEYRFHKTTESMADVEKQLIDGKISIDKYMEEMNGLDYLLQSEAITQDQYNKKIADLKKKLEEGTISLTEYIRTVKGLNGVQAENRQAITDNTVAWAEANDAVDAARQRLETANKELEALNNQATPDPAEIKVKTDEVRDASRELADALAKKAELEEPTELYITTTLDELDTAIAQWQSDHADLYVKVKAKLETDDNGQITIPVKLAKTLSGEEYEQLQQYVDLLNQQHTVNVLADSNTTDSTTELEGAIKLGETLTSTLNNIPNELSIDCSAAQAALDGLLATAMLLANMPPITVPTISGGDASTGKNGKVKVNGTAHVQGTAYANGNWGAKKTETALVGELGPELIVDPDNGTWHTVGDNGAEFTHVKRGSIIFNHKQTESLLKNGYVTGRGKLQGGGSAFASGNAYAYAIGGNSSEEYKLRKELKEDIQKTADKINSTAAEVNDAYNYYLGVSTKNTQLAKTYSKVKTTFDEGKTVDLPDDLMGGSGSGGGGGGSDAKDEFEEVLDWVEIRIEEINEDLDLMAAKLENAVGYKNQNTILDDMISTNKILLENLENGAAEYKRYADKLLQEVPEAYREKAKDGAIQVEEFTNEADEKTVEAINNYREWTQKYADLIQQAEEVEAEIASLAKQKFDNVSQQYENELSLIENINDQLDAQVSLMEDRGYVAAAEYYESMIQNTQQYSEQLELEKQALQNVLDEQVKLGNIKKYSDEWYEMVDAIYEVDASIDDCTASLEEYQNAINDIYWDNFDELINRYDYLADETQNLIDLMENVEEVVADPEKRKYEGGTIEFWTEDDVKWTEEGMASLGLYAQQMEIAEKKAKEYAIAIEDLNEDYKAGKYSETEYLEKLNELKDAQYDSIDAYYEAQDAIKDLNEARIDSIREGVEKEIEAYEELIDKKKEALDAEKD